MYPLIKNVTFQLSGSHNISQHSLWKVRGGKAPGPSPLFGPDLPGEQAPPSDIDPDNDIDPNNNEAE